MPSLLVKSGSESGKSLTVSSSRVKIGRAPGNEVILPDRTVSREHAVLLRCRGDWYIQDVGSHNRVLVNGAPVVSCVVHEGDEIKLGDVLLLFQGSTEDVLEDFSLEVGDTSTEVTQVIPVGMGVEGGGGRSRRLNEAVALGEMASAVRSVPALLHGVQVNLREVLTAERVVPVLKENSGEWKPYVSREGGFGAGPAEVEIDPSLLERACREGPVAARESAEKGRFIACVPVRVGARNLGALYCERPEAEGAFTDEELGHLLYIGVGLAMTIEGLRSHQQLISRTRSLSRQLAEHYDMVGESEEMKRVYRFIHRVAPTKAGVFVCGESGTGKEMVARAIHRNSSRADGPLEIVNCAAVPASLMESELFGHVKGAFTGAVADRPGRFELADRGTLFLDEVGELPLECQSKLLRVLEQDTIRPVGATEDRRVEVRLIAATNHDARTAVEEGRVRADLFYRLDRLRVVVPPLRERAGDVNRLAEHFLRKFGRDCKRPVAGFSHEALEIFNSYDWPGNVRELRNVVERMVLLGDGPILGPELVPEDIKTRVRAAAEGPRSLEAVEREHIIHTLRATQGNKKKAAELLGIHRSTLYAKIQKYGIDQ